MFFDELFPLLYDPLSAFFFDFPLCISLSFGSVRWERLPYLVVFFFFDTLLGRVAFCPERCQGLKLRPAVRR